MKYHFRRIGANGRIKRRPIGYIEVVDGYKLNLRVRAMSANTKKGREETKELQDFLIFALESFYKVRGTPIKSKEVERNVKTMPELQSGTSESASDKHTECNQADMESSAPRPI